MSLRTRSKLTEHRLLISVGFDCHATLYQRLFIEIKEFHQFRYKKHEYVKGDQRQSYRMHS